MLSFERKNVKNPISITLNARELSSNSDSEEDDLSFERMNVKNLIVKPKPELKNLNISVKDYQDIFKPSISTPENLRDDFPEGSPYGEATSNASRISTNPDPDFDTLKPPEEYESLCQSYSFPGNLYGDYLLGNKSDVGSYCDFEVITGDGRSIKMHFPVYRYADYKCETKQVKYEEDESIIRPFIDSLYLGEEGFVWKYSNSGKIDIPIFGLLKFAVKRDHWILRSACIRMICEYNKLSRIDIEIIRKINKPLGNIFLSRKCDEFEEKEKAIEDARLRFYDPTPEPRPTPPKKLFISKSELVELPPMPRPPRAVKRQTGTVWLHPSGRLGGNFA